MTTEKTNTIQAELDALRFQVVELAGKCGAMLSPSSTGEAMSCIEGTVNALRHERMSLITACKDAARQSRMGRNVSDMLIEAVRVATRN